CLASTAPLAIAPAMNLRMWGHAAMQANVGTLRARGADFLGPAEGPMAESESGPGRLLEPQQIVAELAALHGSKLLAGARVLVSAGPTYEDIDPVRFIGNRSSGRMGFAMAEAASGQGARVTLVAGPCALSTPAGVARVDVRSAAEMRGAVLGTIAAQQIFVSAAAVADFRPRRIAPGKIKKGAPELVLELEATEDILAEVASARDRPFVVGFAAESERLREHARGKLEGKRLDLIFANEIGIPGQGFDADR